MSQLALTVAHDQHHFGAHFFRNLFFSPLVFSQHLVVLPRLVLEPKQSHLRDRPPTTGLRQRAAFLEQAQCFLRHRLVGFPLLGLLQVHRDHSRAYRRFRFQSRLLRFVGQGFVISQRVRLPSARQRNRPGREPRVVPIGIWILYLGNHLINILRLILAIHVLEAAGFEIAGGESQRRFLRFGRGAMKKRKRSGVILLGEENLGHPVGGRTGKFTLGVIVEDVLEICPRRRAAIQRPTTLSQVKIGTRPSRHTGILTQILLIFRNSQVIKLSGKKRIGVVELLAVGRFGVGRWSFGRRLLRVFVGHVWPWRYGGIRNGGWRGSPGPQRRRRGLDRHRSRHRRFFHGLRPAHLGRAWLLRRDFSGAGKYDQRREYEARSASPGFHFAVANATFVTPASLQIFRTSTTFL